MKVFVFFSVSFFSLVFLASCSQSEPDRLLSAVKAYRVNGVSVEEALKRKGEKLGESPEYAWRHKKVGEDHYVFEATIGFGGMVKESSTYTWKLIKHFSDNKGETWRLSAENKPAKRLFRNRK